ncbi:hypothetical protein [Selenomonas sp. KH1T6]|uniref:hypothetical protein n=1 Tax=Selenomonas sp. KH1T6 TaxID=3158784 RepID=UPI0008A7FF02|nr:hypothetical protein SAMN05216583_13131 [Selenomonas ruminantium]
MLEDYRLDFGKPHTWLCWGGLILPEVVRNKDCSLMGFIRYGRESREGKLEMDFPESWAVWLDVHHLRGEESKTLCLLWNPIWQDDNHKTTKGLKGESVAIETAPEYFQEVLTGLARQIVGFRPGSRVLRLEEVLSYLKTALQMEISEVSMPEVPLYLDAILSRDMEMKLYSPVSKDKNRLTVKGKEIVVASLKDTLRESRLDLVLGAFREMNYRFCRRVLLMSEDRLEKELRGLTREWCSQRKSMADYMLGKQQGTGGLVSEMLIFAIDAEELAVRQEYIKQILEAVELPYVLEDYNRKSCWWGSLPGMFRAGGKIWPRKVASWEDFLCLG